MKKFTRILTAAASVTAAAAAGSGIFLLNTTMYGKRQTLAEAYEWQANHYDFSWFGKPEPVNYTIRSYDGYELHVSFCENPEPTDRYVILTHGYTDNRLGMLKYMKIYLDAGYNCIIYDLRGHGENKRTFCTYSIREAQDLNALISDTYKRYGKDIFLGLHGESLGAASTVRSLMYRQDVKFAVADCGFADIENVLKGAYAANHVPDFLLKVQSALAGTLYGYSFSEMRPIDALPQNHVPILFIHGAEDNFITPDNSERMKKATAGYAELQLIPGAGHANSVLVQPELYAETVRAFLDKIE